MSTDIPKKIVKRGRPIGDVRPKTLMAQKLQAVLGCSDFDKIADYFGMNRDSAKNYIVGDGRPSAKAMALLRERYLEKHGKVLDINWIIDDDDDRLDPVFIQRKAPGTKVPRAEPITYDAVMNACLSVQAAISDVLLHLNRERDLEPYREDLKGLADTARSLQELLSDF